MIHQDWFPQDEGAVNIWATNFAAQAIVSSNQAGMGWTATTGSAMQTQANAIKTAITAKETALTAYRSAIAAADLQLRTAEAAIRVQVTLGKAATTYTLAVGQLLGVEGAEDSFDKNTYKSELRRVVAEGGGNLRIYFGKARGNVDGQRLYTRHPGQINFTAGATMLRSPYIHHVAVTTPGVPETIEVCTRGIIGNEEVGVFSDIMSVAVT